MTAAGERKGEAGAHWLRVAPLRLRLSADAEIVRQETRGQLWYVVRERLGDRFYRVDPSVYLFLSLLDGARTVEEAHAICQTRLGDDAPGEIEIIRLLWRLHAADLLRGDVAARTEEIVERAERMERTRILHQLRSPLAIRVPLFDPDRLLDRLSPLARLFFSPAGFLFWLTVIGIALGYCATHWEALGANFSDRILAYDNLLLIWLVFPVVKALHEIGHGLALKRWGCESHETGIMFLVFMPVPYIEASSSVRLPEPWRRAVVGAAGLYIELFIAALAMIAWAHMEPGLGRAVAFNVMVIGGVSALLFNGNPLLKFDAYYVLSDLIEIPNLAQRANGWWLYQIQKRLLGVNEAENPVEVRGERGWFAVYAPAALVYRIFLISIIIIFVSKQAFGLGILLAGLAVFSIVVIPFWKAVRFLATSPRLKGARGRAVLGAGAVVAGLAAIIALLPVPHRTVAEGVVWYETGAELRPASGGHVVAFGHDSGARVAAGALVVRLEDSEVEAEIKALTARLDALTAQQRRELAEARERAALTAEEIAFIRERLAEARRRREGLTLRSPVAGRLILPDQSDLKDGWLTRGQAIGHVVGDGASTVRVAVSQAEMDLVSERLNGIEVRLASDLSGVVSAEPVRMTPLATDRLPSPLLSTAGGGPFSLRPAEEGERGDRALETVFVLELLLPDTEAGRFGERAYVRFDHGYETLALQWERKIRQLLLREFNV